MGESEAAGHGVERWPELAKALERNRAEFARRISSNQEREFMYLARHMQPDDAQAIRKLDIPGVQLTREYKRYYPAGEVVGHVVGFTNVDDEGQEGAELAFDHWLGGEVGPQARDPGPHGPQGARTSRTSARARPGRNLNLSLDMRIQYLAYRELKAAIRNNRARSGSIVVIDVTTGEILAMVNQPTFNPNNRGKLTAAMYRNRAVTDILEPGSSIKPFVVAAALESGQFDASSVVDTSPGSIRVGATLIEDEHPNGVLDLAGILSRSSNVGMAKIALRCSRRRSGPR